MDWLKKLPVIGPLVSWLMTTHAWRSYERLDRVHWTRLAAAITFISFLALFPLIAVAAAIGAAMLSTEQLNKIEDKVAEQVPGISDQLGIAGLVAHAGTVGLVAGVLLLFTGVGWIGAMRDCLRAVWEMDDVDQGNPVVRKLKDAGLLVGLGGAALVTLAASTAKLHRGRLDRPAGGHLRPRGRMGCSCRPPPCWWRPWPTSCCCSIC